MEDPKLQQPPEPKPGEPGSIVNITCRAKREGGLPGNCEGKRAKILYNQPNAGHEVLGGGGRRVLYQCVVCDGTFFIGT